MKEYNFWKDSNGFPLIEDCNSHFFAWYYGSPESMSAFDWLYNNINGLQDRYLKYWNIVSEKFANNPYIVGYDPINEPFIGNFLKDPSMLLPGSMDQN